MRIPRSIIGFTLAATLGLAASGCAQPAANPDVRFSGDPLAAIPESVEESTTTTIAPTTTLFFENPQAVDSAE